MNVEKRAGRLNRQGEAEYYVTADDVAILASKAGVGITHSIAQEWLLDPKNRKGIEVAIDMHIKKRMLDL